MDSSDLSPLLANRERLLGYIRGKISDPGLVEDVLQEGLLKALKTSSGLRDEARLVPWFYRILDNAVIDVYRRRQSEAKGLEGLALEKDRFLLQKRSSLSVPVCGSWFQLSNRSMPISSRGWSWSTATLRRLLTTLE